MKNFAALITLIAIVPACASTSQQPDPIVEEAQPQTVDDIKAWLAGFEENYKYDVGYMEELLTLSPAAYEAFAGGMGMAELRGKLPVEAYFVGTTSALLADDCGQCSQLNIRMAVEAGVDRSILKHLLEDPSGLAPNLRLVNRYATQVVGGQNASPELVAQLKETFGDEAFAELAVNVLGVRIYPALRRAMGAETACPAPNLNF
ncbi:MAG: hypothetical protein P1V35_01125 [Planctomycetota bacterium]|nr:hypothetical protein [Planctomycetota bacterium]